MQPIHSLTAHGCAEEKMIVPRGSDLDSRDEVYGLLADAARDKSPVVGLTHNFYRYPARFSPWFARGAINAFSKQGDLVLDPYMGGPNSAGWPLRRGEGATIGVDPDELVSRSVQVESDSHGVAGEPQPFPAGFGIRVRREGRDVRFVLGLVRSFGLIHLLWMRDRGQ